MSLRDEILYHAKIHPEQYSNTLNDDQIKQLHSSIHYVCSTAVDLLGDSDKFPEDWLFRHRWSKGKKNQPSVLPNGAKIVFLTVGGRTSAVVPSVQKKTGPVAKEISDEDAEDDKKTGGKRKRTAAKKEESDSGAEEDDTSEKKTTSKKQKKDIKTEDMAEDSKPAAKSAGKKEETVNEAPVGRRRSTRTRK